ncbi:MAG: hypothetical protein KIS85_08855 [Anaerolineales bacterium]|nr:hypothetical protein [Anaerolineales bacterium]
MVTRITLDGLPAGITLTAARKGEKAQVIARNYLTTADGEEFTIALEGITGYFLSKMPSSSLVVESQIDHLLAIINRDKSAIIYINELQTIAKLRLKQLEINKGDLIRKDDVIDVVKLSFGNIRIPPESGIAFLFSLGWRKGLFYDFAPLHNKEVRNYDLETQLGHCFAYLSHPHLFLIKEADWDAMLKEGWFPFRALSDETIKKLVSFSRNGWLIDDLLAPIEAEVRELLSVMHKQWQSNALFKSHLPFIDKALEAFEKQDYITTTSLLYPRIEGLMRTLSNEFFGTKNPSQKDMSNLVVSVREAEFHSNSLLLPKRFEAYLNQYYFASFNTEKIPLSRNSISHGAAKAEDFNLKASLLGFLILSQIYYLLPDQASQH